MRCQPFSSHSSSLIGKEDANRDGMTALGSVVKWLLSRAFLRDPCPICLRLIRKFQFLNPGMVQSNTITDLSVTLTERVMSLP